MIDILMWAFVALLTGFTVGFKLGTSINTMGGDAYNRGVRDGVDFARIFHSNARDETVDPILTHCPFPKHQGKSWEDVVEEDRSYVEWLVSADAPQMSDRLYDHLLYLLEETPE